MKVKINYTITLLIIIAIIGTACAPMMKATNTHTPAAPQAYVEPALSSTNTDKLSVIVTAGDSDVAAKAVERMGGQVTSNLWLIDAVAATIPTGQLDVLAQMDGIRSIAHNKGVQASQDPIDESGWVTDYRFPVPWDGSPDVEPAGQDGWRHVYPAAIDVGADVVHDGYDGHWVVTGWGVTVAVVDSGVYFSRELQHLFNAAHRNSS